MIKELDPLNPTPETIWKYAQNRPSLIIRDLKRLYGVPERDSAKILMARGAYKWFAVRRDLIRLKDSWRTEISCLHEVLKSAVLPRGSAQRREVVSRLHQLERCRKAVRALCRSERWRVPDNDRHHAGWLRP